MKQTKLPSQPPPHPSSLSTPETENPKSKIQNPKSKIENLSLIFLLLLYLLTALAYAALAPLTTGPDELAHYEYVRFIAEHGRLPLNTEERAQASYKSDQPPLYHLLAALPAALVDPTGPPYLKRVSDDPRRQLIERTRHAWGLYNTEDEGWPYRAEILRWHIGRWVAIFFGAATVVVTFFIARELFSADEQRSEEARKRGSEEAIHAPPLLGTFPALAAAAIVAFIPRFGLTGSMLNYETTLAFFAALFLWVLLRMANERVSESASQRVSESESQPITLHALLLGLFAGLAVLTKLSAVILPLEIIIAFWLMSRHYGWDRSVWLKTCLTALAAMLLVIAFWFGFVLYHFNTVAEDGLWVGLLRPLIAADSSDATTNQLLSVLTGGEAGFTGAIENLESGPPWQWASVFFRTFWLVGIENVQPLVSIAPALALALCLLAAYGLILLMTADRRPPTGDQNATTPPQSFTPYPLLPTPYSRLLLSLLALHLLSPLFLPLLRYAVTFSLADTAQGRHVLFSAAPAFAILLVWGIQAAVSRVMEKQKEVQGGRGAGVQRRKAWLSRLANYTSSLTAYLSRLMFDFSPYALFLPVALLLIWTAAHLGAMTWAYLPPLPVSTVPEAKAQAAQPLNKPLNQFVTLVGYNSQIDPAGRMLQLDLIWQADALSPVDYLTEVSLVDTAGETQAQWLGYSAGGRYPTRAWDKGDIVRDSVWLPIAGLPAGPYQLALRLIPTSRIYPPEAEAAPLTLTDLTLPATGLRTFNGSLAFTAQAVAAAGYSVWQNGQALVTPQEFRYRETILVTLTPLLPGQQRAVEIVGSEESQRFAPLRQVNNTALFIVGPDWPSGDYRLHVTLASSAAEAQQVKSNVILTLVDRWQRQFALPELPPLQGGYVQVEANFANQIKLLGYDVGANRAEPGGGIPLTLYWQSLDWLGQDYTIFTKLISAAPGQSVYGGRDRLPREGYRTIYWAPGEIISDAFGVPVNANAPAGVYYLNLGLYQQVGQQAVSLPLVQEGQPTDASSINIGPIKIGGPPSGATVTTATPQMQLNQPFGDAPNLTLLGYDKAGDNCQLSTVNCQLSIKLYWRSEAPLPLDYTTFVHLRNTAGETVAQKDQPPLNGAYPTSLWDPGEIIADEITVPLPADLPGGSYTIVAGLYDLQTGQRLTVPGYPANELKLTDVTIP